MFKNLFKKTSKIEVTQLVMSDLQYLEGVLMRYFQKARLYEEYRIAVANTTIVYLEQLSITRIYSGRNILKKEYNRICRFLEKYERVKTLVFLYN